jgi:hypothetical protein
MKAQLRGNTLGITILVLALPMFSCGANDPRPGETFENLSATKKLMFRDQETVDTYGDGLIFEARYTVPNPDTLRLVFDEAHLVRLYRIAEDGLIELDDSGRDEVDRLYLEDDLAEQRCRSLTRAVEDLIANETLETPSEWHGETLQQDIVLSSQSPGLGKYGDGLEGEIRRIGDPRARPSRGFIVRLDREGCEESALYRHGSGEVELVARDETDERWSDWRSELDTARVDEKALVDQLLPVFRSWHDTDSAHVGRFRLVEIDDAYVEDELGAGGGHRLHLRVREQSYGRWPRIHSSEEFVVIRDGEVVDASTELRVAES